MGIEGLGDFLKKKGLEPIKINASTFANKKIAIDALWMARAYRSTANNNALDKTNVKECPLKEFDVTKLWLERFLEFITDMYNNKVLPVFVFDGAPPIDKKETCDSRKKLMKEKLIKINECTAKMEKYWNNENVLITIPQTLCDEYKKLLRHNSYVPKEDFNTLKELIKICGCPIIQAPGEAEKLCSSMAIDGYVSAIFSKDTDVLIHGAPLMLKQFNRFFADSYFDAIKVDIVRELLDFNQDELVEFGILCGCDYNQGIKGIGPVRAYKLIKQFHYIDCINDSRVADPSVAKANICRPYFKYDSSKSLLDYDYENIQIDKSYYSEGIDFLNHYELQKYMLQIVKGFDIIVSNNNEIQKVVKYCVPIINSSTIISRTKHI